jgi:RNA polymerase sigma-70 factor (ECF subfamily)
MNDSVESVRAADAIAIERTLAGERDAFRVLVERHSGTIFRLAYRLTGNHHDAEEIVQEAFLRAYQKLGQFAAEANFATWVYRIAANYTIDRKRQMKTEETRRVNPNPEMTEEGESDPLRHVADDAPTPERLTQSVELQRDMKNALASLTPAERVAFVMRHQEGCGIEEIAAALKSNSSAAKNTVFRAVQKLRKALEPQFSARGQARVMGSPS